MTSWLEALQWAAILVVGLLVAGALYQITDLQRRLGPDFGALIPNDGLAVGTPAPDLSAEDARTGDTIGLRNFEHRHVLLAFLSPTCRPCRDLVPHLNRFAQSHRDTAVVVVSIAGTGFDYSRELSALITVAHDAGGKNERAFAVTRTPLIYLLDENGRITNRTISNDLIDLEATVDGMGRQQGTAAWVEVES